MKIAIIGKGSVGSALSSGLSGKHEVKFGHRDPAEPVTDAAKLGEIIILAVPHENANEASEEIRPYADGKIVIDVMNAIGPEHGVRNKLQNIVSGRNPEKTSKPHVVKAFNTVFAQTKA